MAMAMLETSDKDALDVPEYPDTLDIFNFMKMMGFRYWDGGLANQPFILMCEMIRTDSLIKSAYKEAEQEAINQIVEVKNPGDGGRL